MMLNLSEEFIRLTDKRIETIISKHSSDPHNILTTLKLCIELVEKIHKENQFKQETKILVLCNLEFIKVIQELYKVLNISMNNVSFVTVCDIKADVARKFGVNVIRYETYKEFFGDDQLPKFDVIIGNPPYQDNKNKIFYINFIKKGISILEKNGFISMITPKSWISNNYKIFNQTKYNMNILYLDIDDCSKFFKGIGSSFSYFVIKNDIEYKYTEIKHCNKIRKINILEIEDHTDLAITDLEKKIIKKISNNGFIKFQSGRGQNEFKETKDNEYKYEVYLSSKFDRQLVFTNIIPRDYNKLKLIISSILEPGKSLKFSEISKKGVGRYSLYYCNDDIQILKNIQSFFDNNINIFLDSIYRKGRYHTLKIPDIDFTKSWSDEELYKHFGLTKEEIEYIEKNI